jgi:hypothetical protein
MDLYRDKLWVDHRSNRANQAASIISVSSASSLKLGLVRGHSDFLA